MEKPAAKTLKAEIIKIEDFRTFLSYMPNPDIILQKSHEGMEVFREMDTDGRLSSLFRLRRGATLKLPMRFVATGDDRIDEFVKEVLPFRFLGRLGEKLMDALKFGFQPVEIVWKQEGGLWLPDYSKKHEPEYFRFNSRGETIFLSGRGEQPIQGDYKLLIHRNEGTRHDNFYGNSIYSPNYWIWQFKRMGLQFWVAATEKFAVPSLLALFEVENDDAAKERAEELAQIISEIQAGSAGALANVKEIKQIEMKGNIAEFRTLIDTCNMEMSYSITGQTLATGESEYGTRAQGEVHERVLHSFIEHDAKDLCITLQELVSWVIGLNYPGAPVPVIEIDTGDYAPWPQVKDAIEQGIPVSKDALYSVYGLPKPKDEEDSFIKTIQTPALNFSDMLKNEGFFLQTTRRNSSG